MNRDRIRTSLESALAAAPSPDAPRYVLTILLHEANAGDARADQRIVALLNVLRTEPELNVFDGMMQVVPGGANRIEYQTLAGWLIERARSSNINQALDDLEAYLRATDLPFQVTVALSGLNPAAICELSRGISFVPWDSLQDSNQKRSVWERCFMGGPSHLSSGALIRNFTIEKRHIHQDEFQRDMEKYMTLVDATELHDALMCIALVGPFAPHVVASWISFPLWAPMFGGSMMLPQLEGFSSTQPFPEDASVGARSLFEAFSALPVNLQARLRLVMQRLNRAMRRVVPVDASIDLGIALEALYLSDMSDDRGELTFRLKTRAARLLGTGGADRKRIFTLVGDLYGMRSSAVHTGVVASTIRGRPAQEVLAEAFSLTAETARRFITDREPNWDNVMFG